MAQGSTARMWARGGTVFAATVLVLVGIYQIFLGIAAIAHGSFFVVGSNYAYNYSITAWGWVHLAIGALAALTGFFLLTGQMWARIAGIALASLSAVANFFFLPYYPLWSLLIIGLDIFAIWAMASIGSRREMHESAMAGTGMGSGSYTDRDQGDQRWPSTNQPSASQSQGRHYAGERTQEAREATTPDREQAEAMARQGQYGSQGQYGDQSGQPRDPQGPMG
jgi:hypothetical protein